MFAARNILIVTHQINKKAAMLSQLSSTYLHYSKCSKVLLVLSNEGEQDIFVPALCCIAELGSFRNVISLY